MPLEDQKIAAVGKQERSRLGTFIRHRVADPRDADHITGWLYRVARNRITDLFRRKKPESMEAGVGAVTPSAAAQQVEQFDKVCA